MKTHNNSETQLKGLPVQSSKSVVGTKTPGTNNTRTEARPRIDFAKRQANRALPIEQLLPLLRTQAPRIYELAEVVGKWVWIQFQDKQPREVTAVLAELGFHWNNKRQAWQHPCGALTQGSPADPRAKYGSHHPADLQPA